MSKKSVAVDFDGVIHGYRQGWRDGSIYDEPYQGAAPALQTLLDAGYEVVIYTTRADEREVDGVRQPSQIEEVRAYLERHGIPYTRIHQGVGKPLCKLFIDDNALRFEGDWEATTAQALEILSRSIARGDGSGGAIHDRRVFRSIENMSAEEKAALYDDLHEIFTGRTPRPDPPKTDP